VARQFRFTQAVAQQHHFITGAVARIDRYERRVHADFQDMLPPSVDQNRAGRQVVAVAGQQNAYPRTAKTRVADRSARRSHRVQRGAYAYRPLV